MGIEMNGCRCLARMAYTHTVVREIGILTPVNEHLAAAKRLCLLGHDARRHLEHDQLRHRFGKWLYDFVNGVTVHGHAHVQSFGLPETFTKDCNPQLSNNP
jgi:hypothetical protein